MAYTPTNWTNFPSTATPVNASNLNKIETELVALDTGKVDVVEGYGLSENDYTTAEKTKLAGISAQANKVEVTPVVTEGTILATISIDGVDTAIKGSDIDVDDEMSPTSENPVQNKVIYEALNNILPEETAEGNPISITDASGLSAKSCEVTFSPIQSGSGDPSPENVRPISGRDSVVLENDPYYPYSVMWNQLVRNGNFDGKTNWSADAGYFEAADNIATFIPNTTTNKLHQFGFTPIVGHKYLIRADVKATDSNSIPALFSFFNTSETISRITTNVTNWNTIYQFVSVTNLYSTPQIQFRNQGSSASDRTLYIRKVNCFDLTAMFGSTIADYIYSLEQATEGSGVAKCREYGIIKEFYNYNSGEETYMGLVNGEWHYSNSVTFPSTVYGGTVDFVSGKLKVTHDYKNLGNYDWNYNATNSVFWINKSDAKLSNNIICDSFKPTTSTNISGWKDKANNTIGMMTGTTPYRLCVKDSRYTDTSLFKTAMNGVYVCYELATPQEIALTPETIELLKGNNTLWTDGDDITLKYSADIKSYIDSQLSSLS